MSEAWRKIIDERKLETFEDHLAFYRLSEAYKGDKSSYCYDPTLEGFATHLDSIGYLALREEVEVVGAGQLQIEVDDEA